MGENSVNLALYSPQYKIPIIFLFQVCRNSEDERVYADSVLGLIVVDERFPSLGDVGAEGAESGVGRQRIL